MRTLKQKHVRFSLDIIKEVPPGKAYMEQYKVRTMAAADACASRLLKTAKIQDYLAKLRKKMEDDSIATPIERKQVLTEIVRARMTNYMTCSVDGVWMHDIGEETLNSAALKKIRTTTMPFGDKEAGESVILTEVELISPIQAIAELNKMEGIYDAEGGGVVVNNQILNINVSSEKAKGLTERLVAGERTGDNGHKPDDGDNGHKDI